MIEKDGAELFRVKYRFKDETEFITITVTEQQYINLLELPIIATCEIVGKASKPISEDEKEEFNEKIKIASKDDTSHTKYLLK
ncbi:MAG TPA: hypothetical protein VLC72_02615 [Nitrosopumilaceae archaeon]|nr:hypothetical protein [Nitrosopumilaceae archaeon]